MIQKENATISGVLIAIDRQEKGNNTQVSAVQQVSKDLGIPVISIITISDVIEYLRGKDGIYEKELLDMENYRREWGI
jgi:orotate phosphoribosyltransferase